MITLRADDERLTWRGCVEVTPVGGGAVRLNRLPPRDVPLHDEALQRVAGVAAGVRLALRTDSSTISIALGPADTERMTTQSEDGPLRADLSIDGHVVDTAMLTPEGVAALETGADESVDVELWLPHRGAFAVDSVQLDDGARIERTTKQRRVWIAHGSSITQSRFSRSPAMSWPSQVARKLNLDLVNLGFAGECHLEPMIARMMAAMPADLISVCAGINPYTSVSMSERVYRANLHGFVTILRDAHPDIPIVVTSPIASPKREQTPSHPRVAPPFVRCFLRSQRARLPVGAVGPTLAELRDATHEVAQQLIAAGDPNLHTIDGRTLLSTSDADYLVDGLHPDQAGEDLIAQRYGSAFGALVG